MSDLRDMSIRIVPFDDEPLHRRYPTLVEFLEALPSLLGYPSTSLSSLQIIGSLLEQWAAGFTDRDADLGWTFVLSPGHPRVNVAADTWSVRETRQDLARLRSEIDRLRQAPPSPEWGQWVFFHDEDGPVWQPPEVYKGTLLELYEYRATLLEEQLRAPRHVLVRIVSLQGDRE